MPLPRHYVEAAYLADRPNFVNSPLLGPGFLGLGPYRLSRWDPGVQMEFTRFDDYFMGRPNFDTFTLKFHADTNAMVAAILSGSVDVVLPLGVDAEQADEIQQRWEGTGNQVFGSIDGALRYLQIQHRPEYAKPENGLTQRLVRQAFYNATNRDVVADLASKGNAPAADSWFAPNTELRPLVESAIPQFPLDLSLAQQRLAQAGWVKNGQNELVSQATGQRFEIELRAFQEGGAERNLAAIADSWQSTGAKVDQFVVSGALNSDAEFRVTLPGAGITGNIWDMLFTNALDSRLIASVGNRWSGSNRAGYKNPNVDTLYDKLAVTIAPNDRVELHKQLLQEALNDVAIIPLWWEYAPVLALKGVHGIGALIDTSNTWNVFEWNKD